MSSPAEDVDVMGCAEGPLSEGTRVGRFVVVRDLEGQTLAVAAGSVAVVIVIVGMGASLGREGALLMLPGGRLVHVPRTLETVLGWLDGRG